MWTSFSCLPCSCWVLSGGAWCWQERVHLLQCQFQPLVCVYRLTCSLLVASYLLQFSPEICPPDAVYAFRQCHCKAMPFSAERCPNQAGGVAALFHLPHYLFHHFIDSALLRLRRVNSVRLERNGNDRGDASCVTPKTVLTSRRIGIL